MPYPGGWLPVGLLTIVLLTLWTGWSLAALALTVPDRPGLLLAAGWAVGLVLLVPFTPVGWRPCLMLGLVLHATLAVLVARADRARRVPLLGAAAASLAGVLSLGLTGAPLWQLPVVLLLAAAVATPAWYGHRWLGDRVGGAVQAARTEEQTVRDRLERSHARQLANLRRAHAAELAGADRAWGAEVAAARRQVEELGADHRRLDWEARVWRLLGAGRADRSGLGVYCCVTCRSRWVLHTGAELGVTGPLTPDQGCEVCAVLGERNRPAGQEGTAHEPAAAVRPGTERAGS